MKCLLILLTFHIAINLFGVGLWIITLCSGFNDGWNMLPSKLYKCTKLNWFGTIVISIVLFVLFTGPYVLEFLRWSFTVGRK